MASKTKLSAIDAAVKVLDNSDGPMQVPAIIKAAVPLTNLGGKTPGQTIYSVLYAEAKKAKGVRRVERVSKGTFKAATVDPAKVEKTKAAAAKKRTAGRKPASKPAEETAAAAS